MKSARTFPTRIEHAGLPHAYANDGLSSSENNFVASYGATPYHYEKMEAAKQHVLNRARINKMNNTNYVLGGTREMFMKHQEPQGSFNRPLSLSGSIGYGTHLGVHGGGGSFRTQEGSAYGIRKLQERAKQLEMLTQADEEGVGLKPVEEQKIETEDPDILAADLLIEQVRTDLMSGEYSAIKPAELRKLYALLKKIALRLTKEDAERFATSLRNSLQDALTAANIAFERFMETGESAPKELNTILYAGSMVQRCYLLVKLAIATRGIEEKSRKTLFNQLEKDIRKQELPKKGSELNIGDERAKIEKLDELFQSQLEQIAQYPKVEQEAVFGETMTGDIRPDARAEQGEGLQQGADEVGRFAPAEAPGGAAYDVGQYDPYGTTYNPYGTDAPFAPFVPSGVPATEAPIEQEAPKRKRGRPKKKLIIDDDVDE